MSDDLRERVYARISQARDDAYMDCRGMVPFRAAMMAAVDDLIALFAEREREQRARIEALPRHTPVERYGNGVEMRRRDLGGWVRRRDMLAVFDD